jgi:PIN domain nuclease of toxin-antitoxin system
VVAELAHDIGLAVCGLPFRTVVDYALGLNWGRNPFGRLIVANARVNDAPLVTKDARIHSHYPRALW